MRTGSILRFCGLSSRLGVILFLLVALNATSIAGYNVRAQETCQNFNETGQTICGKFLRHWQQNGGLEQQGYPISSMLQEKSDIDGKTYTVQYFERAVFELHPENEAPYDVLLSLLGVIEYKTKYGSNGAPDQHADTNNPTTFPATGKTLGGIFKAFWESHGGLAQQGYPISNEFQERSVLDGEIYTVQYFERAVFEYHPEQQPPYQVLLSQLGRFRFDEKNKALPAPTPTIDQTMPDCYHLHYGRAGTVIGQGSNTTPTGPLNLKTYRVEAVKLPIAITCSVTVTGGQIQTLTFDKYWRVAVIGIPGSFLPGNASFTIWFDDMLLSTAAESRDLSEITALVFDPRLLKEGVTIGVGRDTGGPHIFGTLPEKLHLSASDSRYKGKDRAASKYTRTALAKLAYAS